MKTVNAETLRKFESVCSSIEELEFDDYFVDHVITDPPYAQRTQDNTRRGRKTNRGISEPMSLGFDHATTEKRGRWMSRLSRMARRWTGVFSDVESVGEWKSIGERAGLEYVRTCIWVRTDDVDLTADRPNNAGVGAPQFTGDRPPSDFECIVFFHNADTKKRWFNGGRRATYTSPVVRNDRLHPTEKPLRLLIDILRDFCSVNDTVFDPFCGSGTTQTAARMLGMAGAGGSDLDSKFASLASRRATNATPFKNGQWPMRG